MYDPRAIANCIIDCASERGVSCSNLKLQKLLFFVHGAWLTKYGEPLCSGAFEAWQHGPVHPIVYDAFRPFGAQEISQKTKSIDPVSRHETEIKQPDDVRVLDTVRAVVGSLGHLSGSQLRNITHSKGSPWSVVVAASASSANIGLRIPNEVIRDNFGKQLYLVGEGPEEGELNEDAPYS